MNNEDLVGADDATKAATMKHDLDDLDPEA